MGGCCSCNTVQVNDNSFNMSEKINKFHQNFLEATLTKSTRLSEALNYEMINKEMRLEDSPEQTSLSELTRFTPKFFGLREANGE